MFVFEASKIRHFGANWRQDLALHININFANAK
jgi:hypothetical protein